MSDSTYFFDFTHDVAEKNLKQQISDRFGLLRPSTQNGKTELLNNCSYVVKYALSYINYKGIITHRLVYTKQNEPEENLYIRISSKILTFSDEKDIFTYFRLHTIPTLKTNLDDQNELHYKTFSFLNCDMSSFKINSK